jgi:hypothetical protein
MSDTLTPAELRVLDRMLFNYRRNLLSGSVSMYQSRRRGSSMEFREYKPYDQSDDIRNINWRGYFAHGKMFVKTFLEEAVFNVHILVDNSMSMRAYPDKMHEAIRLTSALSFISRCAALPTAVTMMYGGRPPYRPQQPDSANRHLPAMYDTPERWQKRMHFDQPISFPGGIDITPGEVAYPFVYSAQTCVKQNLRQGGQIFIISDFLFDTAILESVLRLIIKTGFEVRIIHIVSHDETPDTMLWGREPIRIEDAESDHYSIISFDKDEYRRGFNEHLSSIDGAAKRHGLPTLRHYTQQPLVDFLSHHLIDLGIIKL